MVIAAHRRIVYGRSRRRDTLLWKLSVSLATVLSAALVSANGPAAVTSPPPAESQTQHITIPDSDARIHARQQRRSLTLDDIVSLKEFHEPRRSPDGRTVAFVVRQAFRQCNCYRSALYVASAGGGSPRKLDEQAVIGSVRWTPDGRNITYLSSAPGSMQLFRVLAAGGKPVQLLAVSPSERSYWDRGLRPMSSFPNGVLAYEWSHNGRCLAFTASSTDTRDRARRAAEGVPYDPATMKFWDLLDGSFLTPAVTQIWLHCDGDKNPTSLWIGRSGDIGAGCMAWSPDDSSLAFCIEDAAGGKPEVTAAIVDIASRNVRPLDSLSNEAVTALTWSSDGGSLAYAAVTDLVRTWTVGRLDIATLSAHPLVSDVRSTGIWMQFLAWNHDDLLFQATGIGESSDTAGLYRVALAPERGSSRITPPSDKVSECADQIDGEVVCIAERPTRPPGLAFVNVDSGRITALNNVQINPELAKVSVQPITSLRWKNRFGAETTGSLLQAIGTPPFPMVVIAGGFNGDFVTQANSVLTSAPAQLFASSGIEVLLVNSPLFRDWPGNDYDKGSIAQGFSPLSSLESIVETLTRDGLVDHHRIGFLGHSWSGFWVEFAAENSHLFKAVAMINGGSELEPYSYFLYSPVSAEWAKHFLGGPPYGGTLNNYLQFSPSANAQKIRIPFLIQANSTEALLELQIYTPLRLYNAPVEMIVYPNDGHSLASPEHRYNSMRMNLDWFRFWLQGKTDPDPNRADQFKRWARLQSSVTLNAAPQSQHAMH